MKLAVFDVDGTLLTKGNRKAPASCIHALRSLHDKGIKLAIASGRPPFAADACLLKQVPFDYFICSNGAFVRAADGQILYQFNFTLKETTELIDTFKQSDNALMFQCVDAAHCYHGYKRISHMLEGFLGRLDILVDERDQDSYHLDTLPLAAVAKIEDRDMDMMKQKFSQFVFTPFDTCFYDINGLHSKESGIRHICDAMGFSMQEVISFGDDYNDLEMIRACGIGVAMKDGKPQVCKEADYVTDICSKDGIAKALLHFGLIDEVCRDEHIS